MSTAPNTAYTDTANPATHSQTNGGVDHQDFEKATQHMSAQEKHTALHAARFGYGPLAHMKTNAEAMLPGELSCIFGLFENSLIPSSIRW